LKFNVDDRILLIYREIDQVFKLSDVKKKISVNKLDVMPEPTIHANLIRMEEIGLISRIDIPGRQRGRKYHKNFANLKQWFNDFVLKQLNDLRKEDVLTV
jgi:hypothetical protein